MDDRKIITGNTEQEVWTVIQADLAGDEDILSYDAVIAQGGKEVELYIDIDPGGGFEGGYELTQFRAPVTLSVNFSFAAHDEGFIDEIGKFLGMQDIEVGYPDLDKHIIIKSNDESKARMLFADEAVRSVFVELESFDIAIHHADFNGTEQPVLELNIDEGITDAASLQQIYHAFTTVLTAIEA